MRSSSEEHHSAIARSPRVMGRRGLCIVALIGVTALSHCKQGAAPRPRGSDGMQSATQRPRPKGMTVTVDGVYRVDPVAQGKRFQGTWLVRDSGKKLLLTYRPVPKYYPLIGQRVRVTGRYPKIDPRAQRIVGHDHFRVWSMTLLPGQKAGPKRIPTPPTVASKADLAKQVGRWVLAYGTVREREVSPHESHHLRKLVVALPDGTELSTIKRYLQNLRWDEQNPSKEITVVGRVWKDPKQGVYKMTFGAVCQGRVPRCFVGYETGRK